MNTTSAAENGAPSDHFTPSRRVNRSVRSSSSQAYAVANQGVQTPVTRLKISIGSWMPHADGHRADPDTSSGLKLRTQDACCS